MKISTTDLMVKIERINKMTAMVKANKFLSWNRYADIWWTVEVNDVVSNRCERVIMSAKTKNELHNMLQAFEDGIFWTKGM